MIRESIQINAPPDQVWRVVEDPQLMELWNPKVKRVDPVSNGPRCVGYQYWISYEMNSKTSVFLGEIEQFREGERLVIRLAEGTLTSGSVMRESYSLIRTKAGTLLVQSIDLKESGINVFARFLLSFLHRIGKPTGKRYLETLKEIIEKGL